ncbi:MAG: tetratricopeptide repeat protein [Treponema sp.]|nr:tetratricopeptide repeat protein [Treponema sp.]
MNKKRAIVIICGVVVLVLAVVFTLSIRSCASNKAMSSTNNTIKLAENYASLGEYDRALGLLDELLLKDGDNQDVIGLLNRIVKQKKEAEANSGKTEVSNVKVDINTSDITSGLNSAMSSMQDALNQSKMQAEESRKSMEDFLKKQDEKNQEEAAEKLAQEQAEQERKRLAEEKRKAQEEELAKKNAALKKEIDSVNEEIRLGKTALATGNIDEAMKHFEKANSIMPSIDDNGQFSASKKSEIAESLYDAAQKANSKEDKAKLMKDAVEMAKKAIADNPNDSVSHYILAQNAIDENNLQLALSEMLKAVQNDPNNYLYYYDLGKLQYRLKKYTEAVSSFTTSCEKNNKFAPSRYNLGITQKQLKNDTAALSAFRKTIDIDPRHEKAYMELARLLKKRNDLAGAIEAYSNVLKLNNTNTSALTELGSTYYQNGNILEAENNYRKALALLSLSEEQILVKYNLSTILFDENKFEDAEKYAKEAYDGINNVKNDASKVNIIYNYALILDKNGKSDLAIPCYMEVLKINPNHNKTKINLGVMYMTIEPPNVDTALSLFLQVYNNQNDNFEANNNLGSAYLLNEDYANSIKFFQNALKIDSKNDDVRYNLAKAYVKNGDYNNAKTIYLDLLKTDDKNWDAYIELAKVCMQLSDNTNAEKYLIYIQEKNPSYKASEVSSLLGSLN